MKINIKNIKQFLKSNPYDMQEQVDLIHDKIKNKEGHGTNNLGWLDWPKEDHDELLEDILETKEKIRKESEVLVVVGIGGSYLGSKAAIELLNKPFSKSEFEVIFAGHQLSGRYLNNLVDYLRNKDFSINFISKSGETIEPSITFRVLKKLLKDKYGKTYNDRIYATTDYENGLLYKEAIQNDYKRFIIPHDIGGRFSVLTAVGLFPIAVKGYDIGKVLQGARDAYNDLAISNLNSNDAYLYAVSRYLLYMSGKKIEIFSSYEPNFHYLLKWWQQLFSESEGKNNKGLFVSTACFSTDLHSLGQYIQDGERTLFETIIKVNSIKEDVKMFECKDNIDGLNYLEGMKMSYINEQVLKGTMKAHVDGLVPNILIEVEDISEYTFGYFVYFFKLAATMSAYLLEVNPFNQEGVEKYKDIMFELLGKEGY